MRAWFSCVARTTCRGSQGHIGPWCRWPGRTGPKSAAAKPAGPATRQPTSSARCDPTVRLLDKIARESGGQLVDASGLAALVADLPNRRVPITEPAITPLWHQPWVFLLAIACLCGEWGLRRWRGLP